MESSDSDDMEESDPESPSVPDNAAPMPWEVNPRRIRDLVETQPIVPLQYSEWRALKIRSFGDWETEIRHLPAAVRRRLAFGVRMPRPTMVAPSSP